MRTRILNKLTNAEIESYLDSGKETIIIPVGVTEVHGELPVDCETIIAEAISVKIAERVDGLTLINLPFFFPGATAIGRGTVNISIEEGVTYLKAVSRSLLKQGFRKQLFVTLHGPAYLTANTTCMDLFHECKVPFAHCDLLHAMQLARQNGWQPDDEFMGMFVTMIYGAYKIMGQLDFIPLNPNHDPKLSNPIGDAADKKQYFLEELRSLAHSPGSFGNYFLDVNQHGFNEACASSNEREKIASKGIELIDGMLEAFKPEKYTNYLGELDQLIQNEILPKFPHLK